MHAEHATRKTAKRLRQLYADFVSTPKADFFRKMGLDIIMARREGIYFYDAQGKRYINCHCNGGVFNLGHRNGEIIAAVKDALEKYDIGNHHLISAPKALLAERLAASMKLPGQTKEEEIRRVLFGSSGGEAIDLAIKIARGYTRRRGIVSLMGGYHGHTGLAVKTGDAKFLDPFNIDREGFVQIAFEDVSALEGTLAQKPAAIILETVPATLGMPIISPGYMKRVRALCDEHGVVMILDEVQTGLGRTGKMWAYQHYDVSPDIVVTGKGLSGGIYPISATCFRQKFETVFEKDPFIHISTFGGAEVGCYAALRMLELVSAPEFLANVDKLSDLFLRELQALQNEFASLKEVRQLGLFMGLVFADAASCLVFLKALIDNGIFAVYAGNDKRVLQFLPPLVTSEAEARDIVRILRQSFRDLGSIKNRLMKLVVSFMIG